MPFTPWTAIYPDGPATAGQTGLQDVAPAPGGNPDYPGMPADATPVHRDVSITTATTTTIWDPGAGRRFVLASAFISSDTAMRIALVDGSDVQGQRPVDQYAAANGGSSPNLVPVPYPSKIIGQALKVVTAASGNVHVRVSGWEVAQ